MDTKNKARDSLYKTDSNLLRKHKNYDGGNSGFGKCWEKRKKLV
jgi:hypothetical protein